jgi:hypothetical protein
MASPSGFSGVRRGLGIAPLNTDRRTGDTPPTGIAPSRTSVERELSPTCQLVPVRGPSRSIGENSGTQSAPQDRLIHPV